MFRLTSMSYAELAGTIRFARPVRGLGVHTDIHGRRWDIRAIVGQTVCAVPMDQLHPYYSDTSGRTGFGFVSQKWRPYAVEIVGEDGQRGRAVA